MGGCLKNCHVLYVAVSVTCVTSAVVVGLLFSVLFMCMYPSGCMVWCVVVVVSCL